MVGPDLSAEAVAGLRNALDEHAEAIYPPDRMRDHMLAYLERSAEDDVMPTPFAKLNAALNGGIRRGQTILIAAYTGHGKSIVVDQIADHVADSGFRVEVFMTEMSAADRGCRYIARKSGIPIDQLMRREVKTTERWTQVFNALKQLNYTFSLVAGWSPDEVIDRILSGPPYLDLAVIDLVHGFDYEGEADLRLISKKMVEVAKQSTLLHDGTAVVLTAHLNQQQMQGVRSPQRPRPGLHSIKGSSSLAQDSDVVMFVWQQEDEAGQPTGEGGVWLAKHRQGGLAYQPVFLNRGRLRFEVDE